MSMQYNVISFCCIAANILPIGHMIVPRLYYVPESELMDDAGGVSASSFLTLKDLSYKMKPMFEDVPFQWAQALYFTAGLMRALLYI